MDDVLKVFVFLGGIPRLPRKPRDTSKEDENFKNIIQKDGNLSKGVEILNKIWKDWAKGADKRDIRKYGEAFLGSVVVSLSQGLNKKKSDDEELRMKEIINPS